MFRFDRWLHLNNQRKGTEDITDANRLSETDSPIDRVVARAIESQIGSIAALPPEVAVRLKEIYREFVPAYVEIIRIKNKRSAAWQPEEVVLDPEVVADMSHFFSDYQELAREFQQINRQVKNLLKIDRQADRQRFERCVAEIVSGTRGSSLMDSLLGS